MVQDSYAAVVGGIASNIAPLLAMNVNQHTKLSEKRCSWQIMSVHLDVYWTLFQQNVIVWSIPDAPAAALIVLFVSSQALEPGTTWDNLIMALLQSGRLQHVCIDKIHLFLQFGLWFCPEFLALKTSLFSKLLYGSNGAGSNSSCT